MLTYFVIGPILMAIFLYLLPFVKATRIVAIIAQGILLLAAGYLFFISQETAIVTNIGNYEGFLGIRLMVDPLASVFVLLTAFIFLIATIYGFKEENDNLFWFLLFVWEGLLIGVFMARDFFNIFVLMEVATVAVAVLIMYKRDNRSMYDGMIYLMINIVVMQFYLFGIGYMYKITGVLDMDAAMQRIGVMDRNLFFLPYALIMTFVALKCALLPLFTWLPKAHGTPGAPSSISAVLSGLHIKAGVYLFLRFQDVFGEVAITEFFLVIGIVTAMVGIIMALSQTDIKLILAYSTIAQVGLIMTGLNIPDSYSYVGSLYYIINHAMFKSALFLSAGMIVRMYGTRNITKISGVLRKNTLVGVTTIMACLGIIGTPFFGGSISKYFLMANAGGPLLAILIVMNLGTMLVFIRYAQILFGRAEVKGSNVKPDGCQQATAFILGGLCLALGLVGEPVIGFLFQMSVSINLADYIEKIIIFVTSLGVGSLIFGLFIKNGDALLAKIRRMDLGFRGMCVSIGVFFAMVLIAVSVLNRSLV